MTADSNKRGAGRISPRLDAGPKFVVPRLKPADPEVPIRVLRRTAETHFKANDRTPTLTDSRQQSKYAHHN